MKAKKIIQAVGLVLILIGLLFAILFSWKQQSLQELKAFEVKVDALTGDPFLNEEEVRLLVESKLDTLVGRKGLQISLAEIERLIEEQVVVKNAEVYLGVNGVLTVDLQLKRMLVRVKPKATVGYYLDTEGQQMPWVTSYTPRVLTVTGDVDHYQKKALPLLDLAERRHKFNQDLYKFSAWVVADDFWKRQLVQVEINSNGDAELVTLIGDQRIIFGALTEASKKLEKLQLFYSEVITKVGWNKYEEINLKFEKQIVCK